MDYNLFYAIFIACVCYFQYSIIDPERHVESISSEKLRDSYDFIVVGGGSSGSVVASRLSEIEGWNVLLIEAGGEETVEVETPLLADHLVQSPLDWNFTTVPQKIICKANGGVCTEPFGKVLGGSGSLNGMFHLRGIPQDYERWVQLGNKGWGWNDVFPYFKLSENNTDPQYSQDTKNHNTEGKLTIGPNPYKTDLADAYIEAGSHLGYPNVDLNGDSRIGFMYFQGATRDGKRCTSNKAFLRPARYRKNLHVLQHAQVTKLISENNQIKEVIFHKDGKDQTIKVNHEVIVCAGAINSPKLLMLSGFGPKEHLKKLEIEVIADLPVGENLQNHVAIYPYFEVNGGAITENDFSPKSILDFTLENKGPLTLCYGHEATALINSTKFHEDGMPDFQILFASFKPPGNVQAFRSGGWLVRPKSRGFVQLKSKDPFENPLIDPKYLEEPSDYESAIEFIDKIFEINETPSLAKFEPKLITNCSGNRNSREFKECLVEENAISGSHLVGTCIMSENGVVDSDLKVYGVENLRVADASVIPYTMSTNINGGVIMVAERVADKIKKQYGQPTLINQ